MLIESRAASMLDTVMFIDLHGDFTVREFFVTP